MKSQRYTAARLETRFSLRKKSNQKKVSEAMSKSTLQQTMLRWSKQDLPKHSLLTLAKAKYRRTRRDL